MVKSLAGAAGGFLLFFSLVHSSFAQTASPQLVVTWQAVNSYVPSAYVGKALPVPGSKIKASLELISQGTPVSLGGQTVYWYLNDTLIGGGIGKQTIAFTIPSSLVARNLLELRVTIPNYYGSFLLSAVDIPVVQPIAAIYAPYSNNIAQENPVYVKALPYFFNGSFSSFIFKWAVNGQEATNLENPSDANIVLPSGTPSGTELDISLTIQNSIDSTAAVASKNLTYQ